MKGIHGTDDGRSRRGGDTDRSSPRALADTCVRHRGIGGIATSVRAPPRSWALSARSDTVRRMTFANAGTLGAVPGKRDELITHLTRRNDTLSDLGCLAYEVGIHDEQPDTVFVIELWTSADAHRASLAQPEVQESIAAARPLLSGEFGGFQFEVAGSPLRD